MCYGFNIDNGQASNSLPAFVSVKAQKIHSRRAENVGEIMKLTNIAEVKAAISDINTNIGKMTADKVAQRIDQIKRDLSEINDAAKKETEKAFAELAAKDVREFWEKFLSDRSYCAYTIQQSGTAYNVKELQRVVLFNAIDRQYKAIMAEKDPEKTTIAVDTQYFRTLSNFTHNIIRAYSNEIEATNAKKLALNEKSKTEIAGVDFKSCTIAAMEKQANAVLRCLIPSELVGETAIRRADIRQILASSGNTAKIDFTSKTKDATVKMKAENGILNDLLTAFTMRKAGGNYTVVSKAAAHKAGKSAKKAEGKPETKKATATKAETGKVEKAA